MKKYILNVPNSFDKELQGISQKRHMEVEELLKRFVLLGLIAEKIDDDPNGSIIIRQNGEERELLFFTFEKGEFRA